MTDGPSNAVFISYRRDVGGILAMALYQNLTQSGLDAFYDIESIRAGQFDTVIMNQIAARPYFVLVLTPGTLERCRDESDWLRLEIEHALATGRTIVPAHTPNFDFGDFDRFLPPGVGKEIRRFNSQEIPQRWFKYAVQELVEEFLVPTELERTEPSPEEAEVVDAILRQADAAAAVSADELSAQEYFERALARSDKDIEGKIADYSEAIRLNDEYVGAFNNRGNARRAKGDLEGAIADYDEAIRLSPDYALAFNNRGLVRSDQGDLEVGIADFNEAIRIDPRDPDARYNRGNARRAKGDLEGAIADYDEAIHLNPEYAFAYYNRSLARQANGDLEGAIADVERGAPFAPDDPDFPDRLARLRAKQEGQT